VDRRAKYGMSERLGGTLELCWFKFRSIKLCSIKRCSSITPRGHTERNYPLFKVYSIDTLLCLNFAPSSNFALLIKLFCASINKMLSCAHSEGSAATQAIMRRELSARTIALYESYLRRMRDWFESQPGKQHLVVDDTIVGSSVTAIDVCDFLSSDFDLQRVSVTTFAGVASAIKALLRAQKVEVTSEFNASIKAFLSGVKKDIADQRQLVHGSQVSANSHWGSMPTQKWPALSCNNHVA